jgi:hypothetical protein
MAAHAARRPAFLIVAAVVLTTLVSACGRSGKTPRRRPLVGSVVVDGTPAFSGAVSLYPRAGHTGPVAAAEVRDGRYAFTVATGPTAGPHRAVVVFLSDAAEANAFQPRHGKARPPQPAPKPPQADGHDSAAASPTDPNAATTDAMDAGSGAPPQAESLTPAAPLPPNMREFDVEVPAADPPRLDFTIDRGASS